MELLDSDPTTISNDGPLDKLQTSQRHETQRPLTSLPAVFVHSNSSLFLSLSLVRTRTFSKGKSPEIETSAVSKN